MQLVQLCYGTCADEAKLVQIRVELSSYNITCYTMIEHCKKYLVKTTHRVVSSDSVRKSVRLEWLII